MTIIYLTSYTISAITGLYLLSVICGMFTDKNPEAQDENRALAILDEC